MTFEAKIKGVAEVKRAIYAYNAKLGERVSRVALRAGANAMLKQIRNASPVKTGRLKRAIKVKNSKINTLRRNGKIGLFITIYPGKKRSDEKGAWYGKFVELGYNKGSKAVTGSQAVGLGIITRRQLIAKKLSNAKYRGKNKQGIRYRHGGKAVPGQHFVLNTFNSTKDDAARLIVQASEIAAERIAKELNLK